MLRQSPETRVRVSEEGFAEFIGYHHAIAGWTGAVVVICERVGTMDTSCPCGDVMISEMINRLRVFNPQKDDYVADVISEALGNGDRDIDSTIHHSEKHGFYLRRRIVQIRRGRVWMTAGLDEDADVHPSNQRRCLTTVRPLTRSQMILLILESYLPEQEGARTDVLEALRAAEIIDQA